MSTRITLLGTGGTISSVSTEAAGSSRLRAEDLASMVNPQRIRIKTRDVFGKSSRAITPGDMWQLAQVVDEEVRLGADGIVITHGTDTLEETAYALALTTDGNVPVVVTGSMRPPHALGSDASGNVAAALSAAACPDLAGFGPVVVMHDEVHGARWVTKQHSSRLNAFASPATGPIGAVVEGRVEVMVGPPPESDRLPRAAEPTHRVELLWVVAGADGLVVDCIAESIDALVVAGTGGGHVPPPLAESLVILAQRGCPIVLSSRCADGSVLENTYGGVGSERHLLAGGLISAGVLSPAKSRLRMLFGMAAGVAPQDLFPLGKVFP